MSNLLLQELVKTSPSKIIELFEVYFPSNIYDDAKITALLGTESGAPVRTLRFFADSNELGNEITWAGKVYKQFPVTAEGFEYKSGGTLPTPIIRLANISGLISTLSLKLDNFLGVRVTRIRTMAKFLDAVNFALGNLLADPLAEFPREIYYVDRKAEETPEYLAFELASSLDITAVKLPRRVILQNLCNWKFKSSECSYTGSTFSVCDKSLKNCKERFPGSNTTLPYGGFPGAGLLQT